MSVTKNGTLIPPSSRTWDCPRQGTQAQGVAKQSSRADLPSRKPWALLGVLLALGGCTMTSEYVSSIGARAIHGQATVPSGAQTIEVPLQDSAISLWYGGAFYYWLRPESIGLPAGSVTLDRSEFQNIGTAHHEIALPYNGNTVKFVTFGESYSGFKEIKLTHEYRRWYGYPAQGLLVVAIPVDLALSVVTVGGIMIGMPIFVTIDAFKGKPADSTQTSSAAAGANSAVTSTSTQ